MPRIPGPARRIVALFELSVLLISDEEFLRRSLQYRKAPGDRRVKLVSAICNKLSLLEPEWPSELVIGLIRIALLPEAVDERAKLAALSHLIRHARGVRSFEVERDGQTREYVVDVEAPKGVLAWPANSSDLVPTASSLEELERLSRAPRPARVWWSGTGLEKRGQPTETLRRDAVLFYYVEWRGETPFEAGSRLAIEGERLGVPIRAARATTRAAGADDWISSAAVRKAIARIRTLLN